MKKTKILAIFIVAMLLIMTIGMKNVYGFSATKIIQDPVADAGKTTSLTITREVEEVTNPVTNTFTYTITPDASNPTGATGIPTSLTIAFDKETPNASNIASKTGTLDFSNATFNELGDYKFKVTETGTTDATTYPLDPATTTEYYVYISVRNKVDANNTPTGDLIVTLADQTKNKDTGNKMDMKFKSKANHTFITLSNNVTGNMARTDKYFEFKINFIDGTDGEEFLISGDSTYASNPTKLVVGGTNNSVWLKHGETIIIGKKGTVNQIPVGLKYQIVEQGATDYKTYIDGSTTNSKTSSQKTTVEAPAGLLMAGPQDEFNANNRTSFENNKEEDVLTGVFINIGPFVGLIALAVVGIFIIKKTSNKKD